MQTTHLNVIRRLYRLLNISQKIIVCYNFIKYGREFDSFNFANATFVHFMSRDATNAS